MAYGLAEFHQDCRAAIDPKTRKADLEGVRRALESLLGNADFVAQHCGPDAKVGVHELHRDPTHGYLLLAHVFAAGRMSPPHDHGASWAVYGQAVGWTDMTEYERLDDGATPGHADIETARTYRLTPGKAGTFGPHQIHQINFCDGARFVRVTGTDLATIDTFTYDMDAHTVRKSDRSHGAGPAAA
jgi:predicted metal-dependent enzyme (double-stranded beta helix superfamily)